MKLWLLRLVFVFFRANGNRQRGYEKDIVTFALGDLSEYVFLVLFLFETYNSEKSSFL